MKELRDVKRVYDSIEIPEELSSMVEQTIHNSECRNTDNIKEFHNTEFRKTDKFIKRPFKYALVGTAACIMLIVVSLNTNKAFAETMGNIPVVGGIAKVLTIRSYKEADKDKIVKITIPAVQSEEEIAKKVNAIIEKEVDEYTAEAKKRVAEYKKAFLETGGTEEEFANHNIEIQVKYDIKYQDEDVVSFVLTGAESWVSAYDINNYYNLDLKNNKVITLRDLLGDNYIEIANKSIQEQIQERLKEDPNNSYFDESMDGFTSIDDNTRFYLNASKNPVIVFDKYEIAPGSMGIQEFEINLNQR